MPGVYEIIYNNKIFQLPRFRDANDMSEISYYKNGHGKRAKFSKQNLQLLNNTYYRVVEHLL